ncbi:MAG: radical SAM protein [Planctomycetota bacterium]|nr:radical SAM protein [Planctomycetota bacterium]
MGILGRIFGRRTAHVYETEIRWLHRLGAVRAPEAVQWITTSTCDLHCPHCYSHAGRRSPGELTHDEACRLLLDELVALDRPVLVLAGGEPLLRPDFADLVAAAGRRGIPWALHSHGGRVLEQLDAFRAHLPVMVAISLDGPREVHDAFRGRAGSFDRALRAMAELKQIGVSEVVAGTTLHRENADLVADMAPIVLESAADAWGLHLMTPEGRAGEHRELLPTAPQLRRVASFARRLRHSFRVELDNEWGSAGDEDCFYRDASFVCGAGRFACVVSATGEVMPCTTTDLAESEGNVRDVPLSQIWAEGFARFRGTDDALRSDCGDCWLQTRNGVSCRSAAFHGASSTLLEAIR